MSPATVSRAIASLEDRVGVALLLRTTRSVRLTDEGLHFLEQCRRGVAEIEGAFDVLRTSRAVPQGVLTVTAPVVFGQRYVLPVVAELLREYPDLQVRLVLADRIVNVVEEGIDIAIRIAELPNSALHMVRMGSVRRVMSASPQYLALHGNPESMMDLRNHRVIGIEDEAGPHRGWGLDDIRRFGRPAQLSVNNVEAAISAAVAGLGIVRTLSYQIVDEIAAGQLKLLLSDTPAPSLPISLLFQGGRKDHPNIRAFINVAKRFFPAALV